MIQPGFFDPQERLHKIDKNGDPLTRLKQTINWDIFVPCDQCGARQKTPVQRGAQGIRLVLPAMPGKTKEANKLKILVSLNTNVGAPERIRTSDTRIRNPVLYPTELLEQGMVDL